MLERAWFEGRLEQLVGALKEARDCRATFEVRLGAIAEQGSNERLASLEADLVAAQARRGMDASPITTEQSTHGGWHY